MYRRNRRPDVTGLAQRRAMRLSVNPLPDVIDIAVLGPLGATRCSLTVPFERDRVVSLHCCSAPASRRGRHCTPEIDIQHDLNHRTASNDSQSNRTDGAVSDQASISCTQAAKDLSGHGPALITLLFAVDVGGCSPCPDGKGQRTRYG